MATPGQRPVPGVGGAGQHDRDDRLAGLAVEGQERVVHVLAVVAAVGASFLPAVGGVVGPVQVEDDARRHPAPLALPQGALAQGDR